MKPLAARACARPLTAPSTMALLEQPNHARCAIQVPDPPFSAERARSRSSPGYRPATLPLDSLVGSLAACPIPSDLVNHRVDRRDYLCLAEIVSVLTPVCSSRGRPWRHPCLLQGRRAAGKPILTNF